MGVCSNVAPRVKARSQWLCRHPLVSAAVIALLSLIVCIIPAIAGGVPRPRVHDEFSYLLAGDTFAHGRLTNPTHPKWKFFESVHELMTPTYMSKYPPGQGLFLALGQVLTGYPIVGVWISIACMSAAIWWMLRAWFPARAAMSVAALAGCAPALVLGWGMTYWGGAVAALGGAFVWGAVGRLRRAKVKPWIGLIIALGIGICANSRPLESFAAIAPAGVLMIVETLRRRELFARVWLPMIAALVPIVAWMGYYNKSITGSATKLPYQVYTEQYDIVPLFYWGTPHPREYRLPQFEWFYGQRTYRSGFYWRDPIWPTNWIKLEVRKVRPLLGYAQVFGFVPVIACIPLLVAIRKRRRIRWLFAGVLCVVAVALVCVYSLQHYYAAMACLVTALVVACLRELRAWRRNRAINGPTLYVLSVGWMILFLVGTLVFTTYNAAQLKRALSDTTNGLPRTGRIVARPDVEKFVEQHSESGAVIFVSYRPPGGIEEEWVSNSANIDAQRVVWAHDLGDTANAELIAYYPNRKVWKLEIVKLGESLRLSEITSAASPAR